MRGAVVRGMRRPAGEQGGLKPETRTEVTYGERIALVKPDLKAGLTINEALYNRRSWREYNAGALSLEELSGVLWAAAGVNRPEENRLTAPSALALYPIRVYASSPRGSTPMTMRPMRLSVWPKGTTGSSPAPSLRLHGPAQPGLHRRPGGL